ncbi:tryptophan--tRNA ligase [Candidatus Dojkabacteria bacterium]|nr:tryptophan--tRNA ligase [Candidatus Dojkabacteria bacterium]
MNNHEKLKKRLEDLKCDYKIITLDVDSLDLDDQVKAGNLSYKDCVGTLLFKNTKGEYFAFLRRDDRKLDDKKVKNLVNDKKFIFCDENDLQQLGFEPGLLSPVLLSLAKKKIQVYVDEYVKETDMVNCGPAVPGAYLKLSKDDMLKAVGDFEFANFTIPNPMRNPDRTSEKIVYTADTPTGQLHIGHYIGTVQNRVMLQSKYKCYFGIANYHSFSYMQKGEGLYKKPDFIHESTLEIAMDNLAIGIDPEKCVYYIESDVPETCELAMLFSNLVSHSRALRNPTIKDEIKIKGMGERFSLGFINYPMMQAADILLFKADLIPVGKDQVPHIEQSREIARDFNQIYGKTFSVPEALIGKVGNLPGLDNKKMSKSLGNAIVFTDTDDEIKKKIMSMYTDPTRIHPTDPGKVEGNPVFIYHDAFNPDNEEVNDLKERYKKGKVGDVEVKEKLVKAMIAFISPIRDKRHNLKNNPKLLLEILSEGGAKARKVAAETLNEVRDKMKLNF